MENLYERLNLLQSEKKSFKASVQKQGIFQTILQTVKRKRDLDPFFGYDDASQLSEEFEVADEEDEENEDFNEKDFSKTQKKLHV